MNPDCFMISCTIVDCPASVARALYDVDYDYCNFLAVNCYAADFAANAAQLIVSAF